MYKCTRYPLILLWTTSGKLCVVNNPHELICSHNSFGTSNICSAGILCYTSSMTRHQRLKNWLTVNLTFGIKLTRRVSARGVCTFCAETRTSRRVRRVASIKSRGPVCPLVSLLDKTVYRAILDIKGRREFRRCCTIESHRHVSFRRNVLSLIPRRNRGCLRVSFESKRYVGLSII